MKMPEQTELFPVENDKPISEETIKAIVNPAKQDDFIKSHFMFVKIG